MVEYMRLRIFYLNEGNSVKFQVLSLGQLKEAPWECCCEGTNFSLYPVPPVSREHIRTSTLTQEALRCSFSNILILSIRILSIFNSGEE